MTLYYDTSAVVKLIVREAESESALDLFGSAVELASASIGYVEAQSALGRIARDRRLSATRRRRARDDLDRVWSETYVIELDDVLIRSAADTADVLQLTAGDAIHLAAALTVDATELVFATWDAELRRAALEAGLAVAP
ncbi:MAG TPA: type II toxin-antitoxin system VapC family toxin [Gaiellaceae bacterium]|nr:type II toxin-antitoxin system VapC family toxin [Gaiellaceae bacterium]